MSGVSLKGPGLFWLVVDGYNGACGNYLDNRAESGHIRLTVTTSS